MANQTELLLNECSQEISELRKSNEIMAARLDVFDSMMLIFNSSPKDNRYGMKEDVLWKIKKHIEELQKAGQDK